MTRTETPWGPWEPAALADVATLFSSVEVPWWVAGGYAIELAVGYSFRDHSDLDVLLPRRDQRGCHFSRFDLSSGVTWRAFS